MDPTRFDAMIRRFSTGSSRRATFGLLGGGLTSILSRASGEGKKRKGKRKRKKRGTPLPPVSPPPPPDPSLPCLAGQRPCRGACLSTLICCNDADCAGGRTCQDGTCACPADRPLICDGSTICQQCCDVKDCQPLGYNDGQVCQDGSCICTRTNTRRCPDGLCGSCCDETECDRGAWDCVPYLAGHKICYCSSEACRGLSCPAGACAGLCAEPCDTAGAVCCGSGDGRLVCRQDLTVGGLACLPPQE